MSSSTQRPQVTPGKLVVTRGADLGAVFVVGAAAMVIGRGDGAAVRVDGDGVSREHARLSRNAGGAVVLEDLGSVNGTTVNGRTAKTSVLRAGDRIQLGRTCEFEFCYETADDRDTLDLEDENAARSISENLSAAGRNLRRMQMGRGEWESALVGLQRARLELETRAGTDSTELAAVFSDMAECELELGRPDAAAKTAQLAIDLGAARGGSSGMLAAALFTRGRAIALTCQAEGRDLVLQARALAPNVGTLVQKIDGWLGSNQTGA